MTLSFRRNVGSSYLTATRRNFLVLLSVKKKNQCFLSESLTWSPFGEDIKTPQALQVNKGGEKNQFQFETLPNNESREKERKRESEGEERYSHLFPQGRKLRSRDAGRHVGPQPGGTPPCRHRGIVPPSAREHLGHTHLTLGM